MGESASLSHTSLAAYQVQNTRKAGYNEWAIPEKNKQGVKDMEFPGGGVDYQKNSMWNFQGLIKNEVEFPRVTKKK